MTLSVPSTSIHDPVELVCVGGGPGTLGVLAAFDVDGLEALRRRRVVVGDPLEIGAGSLRGPAHRSNSPLDEQIEIANVRGAFSHIAGRFTEDPDALGTPNLRVTAEMLDALGGAVARHVAQVRSRVTGVDIDNTLGVEGRRFVVDFADRSRVVARQIVVAPGSEQVFDPQLESYRSDKLVITSLEASGPTGLEKIRDRLAQATSQSPRVVLLGTSHSIVTAKYLIDQLSDEFPGLVVDVLHKGSVPLFADNIDQWNDLVAALPENWKDKNNAAICPLTGRVERWAGLRHVAREAVRSALAGAGEFGDDYRGKIRFTDYDGEIDRSPGASKLVDDAQVLIQAYGWRARQIPIRHGDDLIKLRTYNNGGKIIQPDENLRLVTENGGPLGHAYGNGFGWGGVDPTGKFQGYAVGLNVYGSGRDGNGENYGYGGIIAGQILRTLNN